MESVDCVVIGAGVVGLAVARALALAGREVIVAEAAGAIGTEISSRNSEVIHAGIYYRPGSLMARFCIAGRKALYAYCREHSVPFRQCGKLLVATMDEQAGQLEAIAARGRVNGVDDLAFLSAAEALRLEPALACTGALLSPSTGIIDSHAFMLALRGEAESGGAAIAFNSPVLSGRAVQGGVVLEVGGADPLTLACRLVVNSAGLSASALARRIDVLPPELVPATYYAKGNYFTLAGRSPFSHLIYPLPEPGGLGIHLTLDLSGSARFGPDVEWVDDLVYDVDPARADLFYRTIRRYWPDLEEGRLQPGYSGIRPKIVAPGSGNQDFVIQDARVHGVAGLINLFGIESPGLTASLAIADHVREIAGAG